eukprot:Nk52_evm44s230 gene=Nk52_evmTU44s230
MDHLKGMEDHLKSRSCEGQDKELQTLIVSIADACRQISLYFANAVVTKAGSVNTFGDEQLTVDVISDKIFFDHLRASKLVATASSEEVAEEKDLGGEGFSVAFDPLDGSSVIDANFAVGTIFGVWPGKGLVGRTGNEQVAAGFAVYGPRTTLILAMGGRVDEYMLHDGKWIVAAENMQINEGKIFAPANLRSAADIDGYHRLVRFWMDNKYTLRYSGGMVPDINHIFAKGKGVFASPASDNAPAKLRLLYEVAPIAFMVEVANGASSDGEGTILDKVVTQCDVRTPVCLGSKQEVARFEEHLSSK